MAQKLDPRTRKAVAQQVYKLGSYHPSIPMAELNAIFAANGLTLLQEDGTAFSGIFCGQEGGSKIELGYLATAEPARFGNELVYKPVTNSVLVLNWYKQGARYEINTYLS